MVRKLALELLEIRQLLAADVALTVESGLLSIRGTTGPDDIRVWQSGTDLIIWSGSGDRAAIQSTVPLADVTSIDFRGRDGDDRFENGSNLPCVANGNNGDDTLLGGAADDQLYGGPGNDELQGGAGNDSLHGDYGDDRLEGGDGDDQLYGWYGDDQLDGGAGNDDLSGYEGNDQLCGGEGNDVLKGHEGKDLLSGDSGDDKLYGWTGADRLTGGDGDDYLSGWTNNDILLGGEGKDTLRGHAGKDLIYGQEGDDIVSGGSGDDVLLGGAGNDQLSGDLGNDWLFGDEAVDSVHGRSVGVQGLDASLGLESQRVAVSAAGDFDRLFGGDGDDLLIDVNGALGMHGGIGNDTIHLILRQGWRDPKGTPRFDGKLSGGYGDDRVTMEFQEPGLFINITGDERDNPASSSEGSQDQLVLQGSAINRGSVIVKFELAGAEPSRTACLRRSGSRKK